MCHNVYHHILLITNTFRSLVRSSSEQLYKNTRNITHCQITKVRPLNVTVKVSNSPFGHKISAYVLLKSNKVKVKVKFTLEQATKTRGGGVKV